MWELYFSTFASTKVAKNPVFLIEGVTYMSESEK